MLYIMIHMILGKKKGQTKFNKESMNTENTIKAIKKIVIPCHAHAKRINPDIEYELECDNAPGHRSKKSQSFMHSKRCPPHVKLGGHPINAKAGRPPNSPDLCAIEYVFNDWGDDVLNRQPRTMVELKKYCQEEWEKIPQWKIQNTYRHMTTVYPWVVANGGNQFKPQ